MLLEEITNELLGKGPMSFVKTSVMMCCTRDGKRDGDEKDALVEGYGYNAVNKARHSYRTV